MHYKEYLYTAVVCFGRVIDFFGLAAGIRLRYVIVHFLVIVSLLFIPIFALVVRTQPDQLYERMFSQSFEDARVEYRDSEEFAAEKIDTGQPGIYVFNDYIAYADSNIVLAAPGELFALDDISLEFGEIFSMIAMYNMYLTQFMLPVLMIALAVLLILHLFFCLLSALFLWALRLTSKPFSFGKIIKISIMSAFPAALISVIFGLMLPAVHIILFQMLTLLTLLLISKKHDKIEKEMVKENDPS